MPFLREIRGALVYREAEPQWLVCDYADHWIPSLCWHWAVWLDGTKFAYCDHHMGVHGGIVIGGQLVDGQYTAAVAG